MDVLNLQPDAGDVQDKTFEVEGYKDHVEEIENAYPEEDWRTPAEIEAENQTKNQQASEMQQASDDAFKPGSVAQESPLNVAEGMPQGQPGEQLQQTQQPQQQVEEPKEPTRFTWQYDENGDIPVEQLQAAYGGKLPEGVIRKLSLTKDYLEIEDRLDELFSDGLNLEAQLEAFNLIRNTPELVERYDHNEDGEITYDDFFDTTNDPDWSEEKDAQLTQEWIAGLESKDAGTRLRALWQQGGAGQNMARYINLRRRHALSDVGEGDKEWSGLSENQAEGLRQSSAGALFDVTGLGLEVLGRFENAVNGESFWEDSDLDERVLQTTNENSLEYLVNHNLKRSAMDTVVYEASYWAIPAIVTGGVAAKVGGTMKAVGAARGMPGLIKAGQFITPSLTPGKITVTGLAKGQGFKTAITQPTGHWAKVKAVQGINLLKSGTKAAIIDTIPAATFANIEESGRGMMQEDGILKGIFASDPNAMFYIPALARHSDSPMFKRADFMFSESAYGGVGAAVIGGLGRTIVGTSEAVLGQLPRMGHRVTKFGNAVARNTTASRRGFSAMVESKVMDGAAIFEQTQRQLMDIAEAAAEGAKKTSEGFKNAFSNGIETDGMMKSAYSAYTNGSKLVGQGYTKARDGIRQVLNDWDEIRHTIGVGNPGSTNSLFSQVDMARAGKAGIPDQQLDLLTKDLIDDIEYKAQTKSRDPFRRRGVASDTSLEGIREVMGRNASRENPARYWGKFLDGPLNIDDFNKASDFDKWAIKNTEVQNAVNKSLLLQLTDQANAAGEMLGKTDIFATDGPMRRIADNLTAGLHQVKKTQYTWDLARKMLAEKGGKLDAEDLIQLNADVAQASSSLLKETRDNVNVMVRMLQQNGDDELAGAVLDVFKVAGADIQSWKDFDAFMKQAIVGGKFKGKVKTGDLVHGLQKVMVQSILSGPKTPGRAALGTTLNSYLNTLNEAFGATIRAPFTGDIAAKKIAIAKLKGQLELVPEAMQIFRKEFNAKWNADIADIQTRYTEAGSPADDLWEAKRIHVEQRGTAGEKAAFYINNITRNLTNNKLFSWSPRALAAVDDTHRWLSARARSKELGMRTALEEVGEDWSKITPEILERAEDLHYKNFLDGDGNLDFSGDAWLDKQFKEITLTTELKGTAAKLDDVFQSIPMIKPFYLFARTGINGLNFSYKNTPLLGALHKESMAILRHTGDDFTELAEYGIKNAQDLKSARNLFAGRQAVGAGVVASMGGMYMAGQLTGNGPADRQLIQQWINAGWKPNHFYIGDVGFDYTTLEPYNVIFSTIADIGDNMELMGSEWAEKRLQAVGYVVGRGLTGKTYMSGLDQLMQIMQMQPGALDKAAANILNNSIPLAGMRNEFGKWINPHMKELNSDMWSSIRNRNQASEVLAGGGALPVKSDLLNGKPIKNWNIISRSFNAVSPVSLDIRNDTPGRRLLLDSHYDLKSTTYSYGGYSFVKDNHVRAHFQKAIGTVPITVGFKKFKNVEEALNHLASRDDVKNSMAKMKANGKNPALWDVDPNDYPHNTLIDNVMDQARSKAWAVINNPSHEGYARLEVLKGEQDGKTSRTRDTRSEILELNYPSKQVERFPK